MFKLQYFLFIGEFKVDTATLYSWIQNCESSSQAEKNKANITDIWQRYFKMSMIAYRTYCSLRMLIRIIYVYGIYITHAISSIDLFEDTCFNNCVCGFALTKLPILSYTSTCRSNLIHVLLHFFLIYKHHTFKFSNTNFIRS